jgi:ABC-type antimicrobial peptide transport system permease subunit
MRRLFATLMIAFSAVALVLAMVGLYGLIAYSVAQRRVEIGVRMSLGADRARVLKMILREGLSLVAFGLDSASPVRWRCPTCWARLLYGVAPRDPFVLAAVALALLVTGALASTVPALRASRSRRLKALRHV